MLLLRSLILMPTELSHTVPTALFLFAHQDDEFGVFYEIQRQVSKKQRVIVVYLTSGTLDGTSSEIRNTESCKVLNLLGVPRNDIYFVGADLRIPDGQLSKHIDTAYSALDALIKEVGLPQRLYLLAWEGGHQDHDAAHLVGVAIAQKFGVMDDCYQFPLYTGFKLPSIFFRLFVAIPANGSVRTFPIPLKSRLRFLRYCLKYPSQVKTWLGLFPFMVAHYIFPGTQILQPVNVSRVAKPPHDGSLLYERRGFMSYQEFDQHTKNFVHQLLKSAKI